MLTLILVASGMLRDQVCALTHIPNPPHERFIGHYSLYSMQVSAKKPFSTLMLPWPWKATCLLDMIIAPKTNLISTLESHHLFCRPTFPTEEKMSLSPLLSLHVARSLILNTQICFPDCRRKECSSVFFCVCV